MIKFIDYLKKGEDYVKGEVMLERGGTDMAGKEDLDYYLEHQSKILKKYQNKYLVFGGVTKLDSGDDRYVAYLDWDGGRWILIWVWLEDDFYRFDLLVRARKSSDTKPLDTSAILDFLNSLELGIKNLRRRIID